MAFVLGILILILGGSMLYYWCKWSVILPHNGVKVVCTVTKTEKFFDEETVYALYQNESGKYVNAENVNSPSPYEGEEIEGYVNPDEPYKVYTPSPLWLEIAALLMAALFTFLGGFLLVMAVCQKLDFDFLSHEGSFTMGEVYSIRVETVDKDVWYIFSIVYTDSEGGEHSFDIRYDNKKMMTGDRCTVVYAKRKNGKYANEIVDM